MNNKIYLFLSGQYYCDHEIVNELFTNLGFIVNYYTNCILLQINLDTKYIDSNIIDYNSLKNFYDKDLTITNMANILMNHRINNHDVNRRLLFEIPSDLEILKELLYEYYKDELLYKKRNISFNKINIIYER